MVKVKVGYEAEVPYKTLFIYKHAQRDIVELINKYRVSIVWIESDSINLVDEVVSKVKGYNVDILVCSTSIDFLEQVLREYGSVKTVLDIPANTLPDFIRFGKDKKTIAIPVYLKPKENLYAMDKEVE